MSKDIKKSGEILELDFSDEIQADFNNFDIGKFKQIIVHVPLPSFGSSNSHIDLCGDLLDASWALELLATCARTMEITVGSGYFKPNITAHLWDPLPGVAAALVDCALLFAEDDVEAGERDRLDEIRAQINEYEGKLDACTPQFPDIVDWYFANLMAAKYEWRSEAPEHYQVHTAEFPEYQVGFFRSARSAMLGGDCFASNEGWILPIEVDVDRFFEVTDQKYRLGEFVKGQILALGGQSFVMAEGLVAHFPIQQFLRSQVCAGFAVGKVQDDWDTGPFDWLDHPSPIMPEILRSDYVGEGERPLQNSSCLVHPTGTMIILSDKSFWHLLYDTAPMNLAAVKRLCEFAGEIASSLSTAVGISASLDCDWTSLSDEDFEQLCYDLIFLHPKFDAETIRKLGKSRSRDGGRDIEVFEVSRWLREKPRKWIFQCKLVKSSSSLGGSKLQDVGDMLELYGAEGFGVLTSATIDATLFDKLDGICRRRGVQQYHMSVLELERALSRNPNIKNRFFPSHEQITEE